MTGWHYNPHTPRGPTRCLIALFALDLVQHTYLLALTFLSFIITSFTYFHSLLGLSEQLISLMHFRYSYSKVQANFIKIYAWIIFNYYLLGGSLHNILQKKDAKNCQNNILCVNFKLLIFCDFHMNGVYIKMKSIPQNSDLLSSKDRAAEIQKIRK